MKQALPRVWGESSGSALIRCRPEDFQVTEELDFVPEGEGEHAFIYLEKCRLNTPDVEERLARLCGVASRDIGYSGLKDRNAVTRQWFSVGLAGRPEPDWQQLHTEDDSLRVLEVTRHRRKLRRGVHRRNRFKLVLRDVQGSREAMHSRLEQIRKAGVPNYFGEQRFGRDGANLGRALAWLRQQRRISRGRRSLYLSVLRSHLFNHLLAARVQAGDWYLPRDGDVCMLQGSRSFFDCEHADADILQRAEACDLHPGVPLWGKGVGDALVARCSGVLETLENSGEMTDFLQRSGPDLAWRAARFLADDFSWQFCDDGILQLDFALGAGSYATALVAEFVDYKEGQTEGGSAGERG
ncbi:MAG: tRNA pseudouridine(13) synthase TruD [Halioglobus sp.]